MKWTLIEIFQKVNFPENEVSVASFTIIPYNNTHCAFITWTCIGGVKVQTGIFDLSTGRPTKCNLNLNLYLRLVIK